MKYWWSVTLIYYHNMNIVSVTIDYMIFFKQNALFTQGKSLLSILDYNFMVLLDFKKTELNASDYVRSYIYWFIPRLQTVCAVVVKVVLFLSCMVLTAYYVSFIAYQLFVFTFNWRIYSYKTFLKWLIGLLCRLNFFHCCLFMLSCIICGVYHLMKI